MFLFLHSDLVVNDMCVPEDGPSRGPSPAGADKRMKVGKVGSAPPPCGPGLACKEVRFREYHCTEEPESE